MAILIVDDSLIVRETLSKQLQDEGYAVLTVPSAAEAYSVLRLDEDSGERGIDLILMDVMMPDIDGIAATNTIKANLATRDIPVIMVTARSESEDLQVAFAAGATDFISKPPDPVELVARVRSVLQLKYEMDRRKARECELMEVTKQLEQANKRLQELSALDGLTGINNRRRYEELLGREWRRAFREKKSIAVAMVDIDEFKAYNDTYGHLAGDDTLVAVAKCLEASLNRAGDFVARFGGEEFVVVLPDTDGEGALAVADKLRESIATLAVVHASSKVKNILSVSIGVASTIPEDAEGQGALVQRADAALYQAKNAGRDCCTRAQ